MGDNFVDHDVFKHSRFYHMERVVNGRDILKLDSRLTAHLAFAFERHRKKSSLICIVN